MKISVLTFCAVLLLQASGVRADTRILCQIVMDHQSGRVLSEAGECDRRMTPASTFKVALAVMAAEDGLIHGPDAPALSWREGEPDWGGAAWRGTVTPATWLRHSVVWYSQRLAARMGTPRLTELARALDYGNADFSGDPGRGNGLERAWIASSLKISPREQITFLSRLLSDDLPVSRAAQAQARGLVQTFKGGVAGKTGGAYPRKADGRFDYARGIGWFIGWADLDGRRVVFARLTRDSIRQKRSPGLRARGAFLRDWPVIAAGLR